MAGINNNNNNNKSKSQDKNKISEIDDQIYRHFEIKKRLGKGAYGIVWKAIDRKSNNIVAVKKIFDAFRNETDAQRTFREIMFLKAFKNHPNVIQLYSIHKATNNLDIYLAFEYMESDLHNVIKRGTILKDIHKRYVMYQLFNAIKYIHSGNVIHRDLKPSNVLIDSKCRCKIADFGLARSVSNRPMGDANTSVDPTEPILTDYVATRWYRAPEILIASKRYTKGIDMWSLGCILGEMIRGKPLFPGSSTVNQIEKIVAALPEVNEKDIEAVGAGFGSVLLNQQINSENNPNIDELLVGSSEDAKNLVKLLLMLNPAQRLTAKEALLHRYIEKFKNSITETELNTDVLPPFRDDVQLTVPEYRSKLYEIMQISEVNKGTDKNSNGSVKTTTKLNNTMKRRDMATPKFESTNNVSTSSKQTSVKISPSKLDEKSKKEYNHNRFTEKKYQQNPMSNHNIANNNNNSNISLINNNVINNNSSNINILNTNTLKQTSNNTGRKQFILYKEAAIATNKTISNNNNNNITNNNHISNTNNLLTGEVKLLKPLSKLKHSKLPLASEKPKILSSPSSIEHSSTSTLENGNSRFRNINHFEKRHSIDCTYHSQGISPNKHQINASAKTIKNSSFTNLNMFNVNKSTFNKAAFNSRLSIEKDKPEFLDINKNIQIHQAFKKTPDLSDNLMNARCNNDIITTSSTTNNDSMDNNNYYEKRLKLLEEKIQKQKLDIKALFNEKEKCNRIQKQAIDLNDYKMNDNNAINNNNVRSLNNNASRKISSTLSITENNSDNRHLRSKFTIAQERNYIKRNNIVGRGGQIAIKHDFGHPDGNHIIHLKEKEYSHENNNINNLRKTQQLIS